MTCILNMRFLSHRHTSKLLSGGNSFSIEFSFYNLSFFLNYVESIFCSAHSEYPGFKTNCLTQLQNIHFHSWIFLWFPHRLFLFLEAGIRFIFTSTDFPGINRTLHPLHIVRFTEWSLIENSDKYMFISLSNKQVCH